MENYEINMDTIALIPIELNKTIVYEKYRKLELEISVMKIIEDSCKYFGSSYQGRHEGTKKLIGTSYKSPIIIEESNNIIYFPTKSPRQSNCAWISLKNIKKYERKKDKTLIEFINNKKILLNISIGSFENQYMRATKLEYILRKRILSLE